jgi:hypothetical protein
VPVLGRRVEIDDAVTQERQALAEQHAALEDLKRQLAERVAAVAERERELRAALGQVAAGKTPAVALPAVVSPEADRLAARAAALAERERALAAREAALEAAETNGAADAGKAAIAELTAALEARARELESRERALEERERIPVDPDGARLAHIEERLDELRAAEEAFLRTRRELAEHTDAISAREQLLAQRERELDEREDGWGGPDLHELESRLRRLETQRQTAQTGSFSGGFRRLEQEGARRPPQS